MMLLNILFSSILLQNLFVFIDGTTGGAVDALLAPAIEDSLQCSFEDESPSNGYCNSTTLAIGEPIPITLYPNGEMEGEVEISLTSEACKDMESLRNYLEQYMKCASKDAQGVGYLCNPYTDQGMKITTGCDQIQPLIGSTPNPRVVLYFVRDDRPFYWPHFIPGRSIATRDTALYSNSTGRTVGPVVNGYRVIGSRIPIDRMPSPRGNGEVIELESLSTAPRVFRIHNLLTDEEAEEIVTSALSITDEKNKMKRSTTGSHEGGSMNNQRTSENAFDGDSDIARRMQKRCFELLGLEFFRYMADGLQTLRYQRGTAYVAHTDPLTPDQFRPEHDVNAQHGGSNRYATVLFYLTDVEEGGETVFVHAPFLHEVQTLAPDASEVAITGTTTATTTAAGEIKGVDGGLAGGKGRKRALTLYEVDDPIVPLLDAIAALKEDPDVAAAVKKDSWEYKMVAQCRSRLGSRPRKAGAILFYSQHPNGVVDKLSEHGGCPVIKGTKWASNLWIWNGPRLGMSSLGGNGRLEAIKDMLPRKAQFLNVDVVGKDGTSLPELYFDNSKMGEMKLGQPFNMNSFCGHLFNVRLDGRVIAYLKVSMDDKVQEFRITRAMMDGQEDPETDRYGVNVGRLGKLGLTICSGCTDLNFNPQ